MTPKTNTKAPLGANLIVISSFFYASYGIWTVLMGDFFDGFTASALRGILVLVMLIPIAIVLRKLEPLRLRKNWPYILGMFISSLFIWGPLYYAILGSGVGISLAINYASIVIGMFFFGWLFGREKLTKVKIISAALGIAGIGLIFIPSISGFGWLALGAAFVSGVFSAANTVLAKKVRYSSAQSTIVMWAVGIVANLIMALIFSKSFPSIGLHIEWLYLILFALASLIASWSFIRGLKLIDAGTAGILGLLEIVFGVLFGVILFYERPTLITIIGMVVIIFAAALPYIPRASQKLLAAK